MKKKTVEIESVLDLPIEKQKAIAKIMKMSHSEWVKVTKKNAREADEFLKKIKWGVRPKGYTEEDARRFQSRVDSAGISAIHDIDGTQIWGETEEQD